MNPLLTGAEIPWATMATVFSASILGSLHCVGMCGPFVAVYSAAASSPEGRGDASSPDRWVEGVPSAGRRAGRCGGAPVGANVLHHAAYHGGRAVTYVTLGALAGAAGRAIDWAGQAAGWVHAAAVLCGGLVVLWGLSSLFPLFRVRSPLRGLLAPQLVQLRAKPRAVRASLLGVFTPLLPCGWLYAFVITAAGTGHALAGALVMSAFWSGTVPALLGAGVIFGRMGRAIRARLPLLTGVALIVVGLTGVVSRALLPAPGSNVAHSDLPPPCH